MTTIRRQLDATGGYRLPSGVRYTGLAARHAVDHEIRVSGYVPVGEWEGGTRLFVPKDNDGLQSAETKERTERDI